jgi:hypothetical protein
MYTCIKKCCWFLSILCILVPLSVQAASGTPNSPYFGYGARVYLSGESPQSAIQEAGNFNLDWIAIDFNWAELQPTADTPPNWSKLDATMAAADESQVSVLISITNAPSWAMGENGPNKQKTADLASQLADRFPENLLALELFPSSNTRKGWGAQPNPMAYVKLLKATSKAVGQNILLVAAGLTPLHSASDGIEDVEFLRQLYAAGALEYMPIVGLRLPALGNDPLTPLHEAEGNTLRHYEEIHNMMLENGHDGGLIWVTGFAWDSGTLGSIEEQAGWLKQAYLLMRSQLYIGAAFFDGLNFSYTDTKALLLPGGTHHLGFEELAQLIALDSDEQTIQISLAFSKKLSNKNLAKGR